MLRRDFSGTPDREQRTASARPLAAENRGDLRRCDDQRAMARRHDFARAHAASATSLVSRRTNVCRRRRPIGGDARFGSGVPPATLMARRRRGNQLDFFPPRLVRTRLREIEHGPNIGCRHSEEPACPPCYTHSAEAHFVSRAPHRCRIPAIRRGYHVRPTNLSGPICGDSDRGREAETIAVN